MAETGSESHLPARRGDKARHLLVRRDALDAAEKDLASKRRQRLVLRVMLGGGAGTKLVSELVQGSDPLTALLFSVFVLIVLVVPVELSWRPVILRLDDLVATLRTEVGRISSRGEAGRLDSGTGV